ncbi:class I SAM-dependent methyltransferase [Desulfuribacillus alkaliarsenatis]|uniref:Methyltransferase small domain-containing protein n=1 Tax=Desulfuribacillus alkaliarsenatis TaxID=766136 RepID=A0A1E5FYJ6_9FIRM|nr:methyltransferase [Desulfuribacillus alkaliarsenatis]OEF95608.1 hypothetical protein BHF68_12250 [Desulfuribacillus alkaliarsenatis]
MSWSTLNEKATFLYKFIKKPKQIGSITPSSRYLVRKMLETVDFNKTNSVVELGAGTGVITQEIYNSKKSDTDFYIFEYDDEMRAVLKNIYKTAAYCKDAYELKDTLSSYGASEVDCIISCLPLATFSETGRQAIMEQVIESLSDDGIFVAYQYSLQMKQLLSKNFSKVTIQFVPLNIPPAFIYICQK